MATITTTDLMLNIASLRQDRDLLKLKLELIENEIEQRQIILFNSIPQMESTKPQKQETPQ